MDCVYSVRARRLLGFLSVSCVSSVASALDLLFGYTITKNGKWVLMDLPPILKTIYANWVFNLKPTVDRPPSNIR
jgi:hypothetical protein